MQNISAVLNAVIKGDCHRILQEIPDNSVDSVITSSPDVRQKDCEKNQRFLYHDERTK